MVWDVTRLNEAWRGAWTELSESVEVDEESFTHSATCKSHTAPPPKDREVKVLKPTGSFLINEKTEV